MSGQSAFGNSNTPKLIKIKCTVDGEHFVFEVLQNHLVFEREFLQEHSEVVLGCLGGQSSLAILGPVHYLDRSDFFLNERNSLLLMGFFE